MKGQAALEYLLTYGWALVVIAIIIGSLLLLTSQSSSPHQCQMNPSSGGLTYIDHSVQANGLLQISFRNDSGKTISDVNATFSGDFLGYPSTLNNGPYLSAQQFNLNSTNASMRKGSYSGTISIKYIRKGVMHASTAICSGNN
jgi:hypothetical protein